MSKISLTKAHLAAGAVSVVLVGGGVAFLTHVAASKTTAAKIHQLATSHHAAPLIQLYRRDFNQGITKWNSILISTIAQTQTMRAKQFLSLLIGNSSTSVTVVDQAISAFCQYDASSSDASTIVSFLSDTSDVRATEMILGTLTTLQAPLSGHYSEILGLLRSTPALQPSIAALLRAQPGSVLNAHLTRYVTARLDSDNFSTAASIVSLLAQSGLVLASVQTNAITMLKGLGRIHQTLVAYGNAVDQLKTIANQKYIAYQVLTAYMVAETSPGKYEIALATYSPFVGEIPSSTHALLYSTTQFTSKGWFTMDVSNIGTESVQLNQQAGGFTAEWTTYMQVTPSLKKKDQNIISARDELPRKESLYQGYQATFARQKAQVVALIPHLWKP